MSSGRSGAAPSRGPSPFELLHPAGSTPRWASRGAAGIGALAPAHPPEEDRAGELDLLLLAPSRAERRDRGWIAEAAELVRLVAADGLVAALRPPRALVDAATAHGMVVATRLLHLPDVERSRFVLPPGGPEAAFAMRSLTRPSAPKRLAARLAARMPASGPLPTSVVLRRRDAAPLGSWLATLALPVERCSMAVARSWRPGGATVAMRFSGGPSPDVIAKVGGSGVAEADGLREVGPGAQRARLAVPRLLAEAHLGSLPVVAETPVPGRPAALEVAGSAARAARHLEAFARHLREWQRATAVRRPLSDADAELLLTGPAGRLAEELPSGYAESLAATARELVGTEVPFVAAHRDTTAANVMVGRGGRIGLIDWEEAVAATLPLGDLAYSAADFAAASDGYRDRVAAYRQCFEPGGAFHPLTATLIDEAAAELGIGGSLRALALQACWLRHADNERREGGRERPFLDILRLAAGEWAQ